MVRGRGAPVRRPGLSGGRDSVQKRPPLLARAAEGSAAPPPSLSGGPGGGPPTVHIPRSPRTMPYPQVRQSVISPGSPECHIPRSVRVPYPQVRQSVISPGPPECHIPRSVRVPYPQVPEKHTEIFLSVRSYIPRSAGTLLYHQVPSQNTEVLWKSRGRPTEAPRRIGGAARSAWSF